MNEFRPSNIEQKPMGVAAYIEQLNHVLKAQRGRIIGEVTAIKEYPWGVIFTIKDKGDNAILDCMVWSRDYQANGVELKAGDEIIVTGCPDIHAPNGRLSFKAVTIEYAGEGALKRDYEKLKAKLTAEGLFAPTRKRPLPALPTKIGVITSMRGVVIQDFTTNLGQHGFTIKTVDSRVEGKDAIHELLAAVKTMSKQEDIEVLVIMRGGGSLEALQAFNTEAIVRAIAGFKVPVITGIGHDVDVTLSEMAADVGRSTPTAVAEALNEQWDGLTHRVEMLQNKTLGTYRASLVASRQVIDAEANSVFRLYERRLAQVRNVVSNKSGDVRAIYTRLADRVREATMVLRTATSIMKSAIRAKHRYLTQLPSELRRCTRPVVVQTEKRMSTIFAQISSYQADAVDTSRLSMKDNFTQTSDALATCIKSSLQSIDDSTRCIIRVQRTAVQSTKRLLPALEKQITAHDPKRRMRQGYSLSFANGKLLRSTADATAGETITTQLADGEFTSLIKEVQ